MTSTPGPRDRRRPDTNRIDDRDRMPFARLHDQTWTPLGATAKQRTGAWPAHGVLLGATAYSRPAPEPTTATKARFGNGRCFSTPDTTPTAANARSNHDPTRPAGLGNQVRALLATPTTVAAEHPGIATIQPGQQEQRSAQVIALMPTPQAKLGTAGPDYARAGRAGSGGDDLITIIAKTELLPTPTARDHKGPNQRGDRTCLTGALLPTPKASDATKGSPHQHGSSGDLTLPSAVHLLPTPTAGDARSSAIQTVQQPGRPIPAGAVTLTDAARLLPTPSVADALGGHRSRSGTRSGELLLPGIAQTLAPAPDADAAGETTTGSKHSEDRG